MSHLTQQFLCLCPLSDPSRIHWFKIPKLRTLVPLALLFLHNTQPLLSVALGFVISLLRTVTGLTVSTCALVIVLTQLSTSATMVCMILTITLPTSQLLVGWSWICLPVLISAKGRADSGVRWNFKTDFANYWLCDLQGFLFVSP